MRTRLWQGGVGLAVLLGTLVVGNFYIAPDRAVSPHMIGHDFLAFYTAGTIARQGRFQELYDLQTVRAMEHSVARQNNLEVGTSFGPFWNPPFYAWVFAPLSALPYRTALSSWLALNVACAAGAIVLLIRMLPPIVARVPQRVHLSVDEPLPVCFTRDWRNWLLVPLLLVVSMPFIQALSHAQNTFMSLLLMCGVVTAWRSRRAAAAGFFCGLLFYKPQLAAVVAAMLVLSLGLRALLGLGFVLLSFALVSAWTMGDALGNYMYQLPLNLTFIQVEHAYLWERHVTLKAFWRLLLHGRDAGDISGMASWLTVLSCALAGFGLLVAWWRTRRPGIDDVWTGETRAVARDRLIIATIAATPLLMPFYFDYDLLLLAVPAVLQAGIVLWRAPGRSLDGLHVWLMRAWIALYAWLMVNPPLARLTHVGGAVILLSCAAGLSIALACRRGLRTSSLTLPQVQRVHVKRAA